MKNIEYRYFNSTELETRSPTTDDFIGQIAGYAIKFNTPSTAKAPFIEYIAPTALEGVDLSEVLGLYNHDFANVLGRVDSGTLKLKIDKTGLYFTLDMPDTTVGHDVYNNIKAGNLKGMSFGFIVADSGDSWQQGSEKPIRIINQLDTLSEISVVSRPAYDDTSVQVTRSMDAFLLERTRKYKEKVNIYLGGFNEN